MRPERFVPAYKARRQRRRVLTIDAVNRYVVAVVEAARRLVRRRPK